MWMSVRRELVAVVKIVSTLLGHITAPVTVDLNDIIPMNAEVRI